VKIDWEAVLKKTATGAVIGSIAGIVPDALEPATNPSRREFFHSKTAVFLTMAGILKVGTSKIDVKQKQIGICVLAGILSHHYGDSQTPFGLPDY
jgi:hypothetical protein